MKAYLQVLSTGTADCSPSIILHFDSQRYMINCGEGTQRLCMESKLRFSKLQTILFTRNHWECFGGVPGMLLTLSDVGLRNIKLLGGENLTHAMTSTRHFVYRNTMAVDTFEFSQDNNKYQDENLRITSVQILPENFERSAPREWPLTKSSVQSPNGSPSGSPSSSPTSAPQTAKIVVPELAPNGVPVVVGSKRNSNEVQSPTIESVESPMDIRKRVLGNMFNVSKFGNLTLPTKKAKKDPRAKSSTSDGQTDVDMILASQAAAADTNDGKTCGGKPRGSYTDLPRTSPIPTAISYIFQSPDYVGKFNKQAALDLGVRPGKLFGQLVNGKSVESTTGEMVHPHQVISGARPGRVFMVVDCPDLGYLSNLVQASEFSKFQKGSEGLQAACIVHLAGHDVVSHPQYKEWMLRFGEETQHIMANQEYCSQKLIWRSQSQGCYKLSKLDSNIFPVPYYDNNPVHALQEDLKDVPVKASLAESMMTYILEPSTGVDESEVVKPMTLDPNYDSLKDHSKQYLREYYELSEKAQQDIAADAASTLEEFPGRDVVLTALGTGSSHPSKYRNVSATLLEIPRDGTFLLDAGEGTYGQMFRQFGGYRRTPDQKNSVDTRIENMKGIFISHLHADHHLGIVSVIDRWNKLRHADTEPLYLIAPMRFNTFLQELSDVQDFGYHNVKFIESEDIVYWRDPAKDWRKQNARPAMSDLLRSSGFRDISTVDVIHCPWSYGISMTHQSGWKIVYSGDTRPCQNLVQAGHGATVLLHEATFEDDMQDEALKKKHSTTQEAIAVGEGMEARFTMLTHFSQRYPKIPRFDHEDKSTLIGICFDLMSVPLGQIYKLPKFLPALQVLYSAQSDEAKEGEEESNDSELKSLQQATE
ncbi:Zinc phosphodiesterase ELAC protein 2 [Podila verticillata]|nr:Zinc phosphodiesterase ELAC protein 2 [Podila verticillata]KAI9231907.1 MAG: beta-lactamase-like protein [Podila humilis]